VPPEAEDEDVIRAVASVQARWDEVAAPCPGDDIAANATRIHLRLGLAPVRRPWLAESGGAVIGLLTVAGMAAGLRERVVQPL